MERRNVMFGGLAAICLVLILSSARKPLPAGGNGGGTRSATRPDAAAASGSIGRIVPEATPEAENRGGAIPWITIEDAAGKLQQQQRPILIDLYTTWCGWCRQMDRKTYSNKKVSQYLTDKFYTVRIDAETHAAITWQGKTYQFDPRYKCNEFAVYLSHGQLEFPTTVIIPPGEAPQAIPGYMEPKDFEMLVKYFGEGVYKTRGFDEYQRNFHASW